MIDILATLNRRLQLKQRKIMLFMDNAPCHPASLQGKFSNINIVILPKKKHRRHGHLIAHNRKLEVQLQEKVVASCL